MVAVACGGQTLSASPSAQALEKPVVAVGAMPIPDCATLQIATERGFFRNEGLTVEVKEIQSGAYALTNLVGGSLDFAIGNYVSTITAQAKSGDAQPWRFLEDAYEATPGTFLLMVPGSSKAKDLPDLRGARIAVAAPFSIITLAVENALKTAGMSPADVHMVPMALPQMIPAMQNHQVDAAVLTEPFITLFSAKFGGREVSDLMSGAMANFPIAGWMTTAKFTGKYPKTAAAFQRAMFRAQAVAAGDRTAVVRAIPKYTKIAPDVASAITLGNYPLHLDLTRVQRVVDLLEEHHYIDSRPDINDMLAPAPTATASTS
ncbi:ABC transporter substrate-binding protein [Sphaerisporangium sp. NPDC005288]|uniref:ABC transporter substrate-binding protein n=1 Tax=Sphaerisporangium sp. NPDC005288 TaxID=3155114 RepID=UPI0033AB9ED2